MKAETTTIIEITGIMGAGFLPGLLQQLKMEFEQSFLHVASDNTLRNIATIFHVDNTWAWERNKRKRDRVDYLIKNAAHLASEEWSELIASLNWIDNLFAKNVAYWQRKSGSIDIAFRRGGLLQTYILLHGIRWEEATINRKPQPQVKILLTANQCEIRRTHEHDLNTMELIQADPASYCLTPEWAYERQQEWLDSVKGYPGVYIIERNRFTKEDFAIDLAREMRDLVRPYIKLEYKVKLFISYAKKDEIIAKRLYDDLMRNGMQCWFAPEDLKSGDRFRQVIEESIHSHSKLLVVLSGSSISSDWVKEEVETAMERERQEKADILFPIRIDNAVMETKEAWAASLRRMRHIGDFTNWSDESEYRKAFTRLLRDLRK